MDYPDICFWIIFVLTLSDSGFDNLWIFKNFRKERQSILGFTVFSMIEIEIFDQNDGTFLCLFFLVGIVGVVESDIW